MTPSEITTIILAVIGTSGLGGLALGIYNAWIDAKKGTVDEWRGLLEEQRKLLEELKKKLQDRDEEIEDLKDWAVRLVSQVRSLGHEPVSFKSMKDQTDR